MDEKMGQSEFYREVLVTTASDMSEPRAVDFGAPKNLQTINNTFINYAEFIQTGRQPTVSMVGFEQVGFEQAGWAEAEAGWTQARQAIRPA
jgi:hypothetical protein